MKLLKNNEGNVDRVFRIALGAGLLSLVFAGLQSAWGWLGRRRRRDRVVAPSC